MSVALAATICEVNDGPCGPASVLLVPRGVPQELAGGRVVTIVPRTITNSPASVLNARPSLPHLRTRIGIPVRVGTLNELTVFPCARSTESTFRPCSAWSHRTKNPSPLSLSGVITELTTPPEVALTVFFDGSNTVPSSPYINPEAK